MISSREKAIVRPNSMTALHPDKVTLRRYHAKRKKLMSKIEKAKTDTERERLTKALDKLDRGFFDSGFYETRGET